MAGHARGTYPLRGDRPMSEPGPPPPDARESREPRWLDALLFALPFAFFWWQLPFVSSLTIVNDYTICPTRQL